MSERLHIVNCAELADSGWTFLKEPLADLPLDWSFFSAVPRTALERWIRRPNLARWRCAWAAASNAAQHPGSVIISHLPRTTLWVSLFCRLRGIEAKHIAFAFNFTELPTGFNRWLMRWAFKRVDRFVVYSTVERSLYADYFGIEPDRLDFLPWVMETPRASEPPFVAGRYICAVGGEGRDYDTLVEAVRGMPDIPTVIVTRSYNAPRAPLPPNVTLFTELRLDDFWNVVKHCRFMVVPLRDNQTNCGHITIVGGLQLGRPIVATASRGIEDYVKSDTNALVVAPSKPADLAAAIGRLWADPLLYGKLQTAIVEGMGSRGSDSAWTDYLRRQFARGVNPRDSLT